MKKSIPILILMGMVVLLVISWSNIMNYKNDIEKEYQQHIDAADAYLKKDIKIDAVYEYERALEIKPSNYKLAMKIGGLYKDLELYNDYIAALKKAIDADKTKAKPYLDVAKYYLSINNYLDAYSVLSLAETNDVKNKDIEKKLIELRGRFVLSTPKPGQEVRACYIDGNDPGYYVTKSDKGAALFTTDGQTIVPLDKGYEDVGLQSNDYISVCKDSEYFYITPQGYRKLVPDEKAEYLGTFGSGYAPACFDGKWGYVAEDMKPQHMDYTHTYPFSNGVAAVEDDGKWYVVDTNFEKVGGKTFEDVKMDDYGYCSTYGVFWAKNDGKYDLYDLQGNKLTKKGYDDAKLFVSDEAAPVKSGDKWGYVSKEGKEIIKPEYEDANAFNVGYGPVSIDGKWGAIDKNRNIVIEPRFQSFDSFDKSGKAVVKESGAISIMSVELYKSR